MRKIILLFLLSGANFLWALEPVILTEEKGEYPLGLYLEILEDKEGKLSLDDIQKPEMENQWIKSEKEVPSFGFSKSVYWVRFKLISSLNQEYFLEIGYPLLDKIDLFIIEQGTTKLKKHTGDMYDFKQRDLEYRNFVFILNPSNYPKGEYFIRFESESSMQLPLVLWVPKAFSEKKTNEMLGMGLYFGVMFVMFFYNLFIWFSVRDKSYLYYVGYILFFSNFIGNNSGITYQYFLSEFPVFSNSVFVVPIFVFIFFMLFFTSNFLQLKQNSPRFYKSFLVLLGIDIILFFTALFLSYRLKITIAALLAIIAFVWCFVVGIKISFTKYRPAKYYILAWSSFIFGSLILTFKAFGIVPSNVFTDHSVQLGSALEVILLSLGLADRINELKRQNEITQIKILEAEKRSSKIKDEFLSNLSHELKTPLSVVYSYSELLKTGPNSPEKVMKYSTRIYESAEKLNDYVSDLILISDLESNLQLQKTNTKLVPIFEKVSEFYKPYLEDKKIQLELNLNPNLECNCDPILCEKVFSVLLKNAILYNRMDGKIGIFENSTDAEFILKITDTGIGIPKEFYQKIFDKFFRIDSSLTYEVSGVGVGLYIAKKIVELHGGNISVKSEVGAGSEFTIHIPLK